VTLDVEAFLGRLGADGPDVKALAGAWEARPTPDRLADAFASGGVELDPYEAVVATVALDEALAELAMDREVVALAPDVFTPDRAAERDLEPGLHVAPALAGRLPLLELAEDLAAHLGSLSVETSPPGESTGFTGYFAPHPFGVVILIDDARDDDAVRRTFAHELAHLLDPDRGRVSREGLEALADTLGPALLYAQPATVEEAAVWVAVGVQMVAGLRAPRAAGGVRAILELILLELACLRMPARELADDLPHGGGSGRAGGGSSSDAASVSRSRQAPAARPVRVFGSNSGIRA